MNAPLVSRAATILATTLLLAAPAQGQIFRAYLDPTGSDANPCTLQLPCRLLPAALAAVTNGGEIWMLDSANYNATQVNVTKSVTILAVPGALGSVVSAGGNAINIATVGVKVVLRNLMIVPLPGGGGTNGVSMTQGAGLTIDGCVIANQPGWGVMVNANLAAVRITDSTIRDNIFDNIMLANGARATLTRANVSGSSAAGVYLEGATAATTTTVDIGDSTLDGNSYGVFVKALNSTAVVRGSVRGSRVVRNANDGLAAQSTPGATVNLSASGNIVSNNGTGIRAVTGAKVWASGNTVSDNTTGLNNTGSTLESAGTNAVRNNGTDTTGSITTVPTL